MNFAFLRLDLLISTKVGRDRTLLLNIWSWVSWDVVQANKDLTNQNPRHIDEEKSTENGKLIIV